MTNPAIEELKRRKRIAYAVWSLIGPDTMSIPDLTQARDWAEVSLKGENRTAVVEKINEALRKKVLEVVEK